jgi:hypothetical protein
MKQWMLVSIVAVLFATQNAQGSMYTGSLSTASSEILGVGAWISPGPTTMAWTVQDNSDGSWNYSYTLTVVSQEISHLILETSESFFDSDPYTSTPDDLFNLTVGQGSVGDIEIKNHLGLSPGNPNMPDDVYGIKFDDTAGLVLQVSFDSVRSPVWGDFYAKDGGSPTLQAWNAGLTKPDSDPLALPSDGSLDNHILVPDTFKQTVIPEPGTLLIWSVLGALGTAFGWWRRRRKAA